MTMLSQEELCKSQEECLWRSSEAVGHASIVTRTRGE